VYTGHKIDLSSLKAELMVAMINYKVKRGFFFLDQQLTNQF